MNRRVEDVVIVGRDAEAWLAAMTLLGALGGTGLRVRVVELPSALSPHHAYSAAPSLGGSHARLGLGEADVLRACRGVPVLGQRFAGWAGGDDAFMHGYEGKQPAINHIDFLQYWVKAHGAGLRVPLQDFSIAAVAAQQNRIARNDGDSDSATTLHPGYHLHAPAYATAMGRLALARGVVQTAGPLAEVEREGERIVAISTLAGERIPGDLFVDASGDARALIGGQPGAEREDWSHWLPCDRIVTASGPALKPLPGFAEIRAFEGGWVGLFPLQNRTAMIATYASASVPDEDLIARLPQLTGMPLVGVSLPSAFKAGAERRPWIGNCVAIGSAAASIEPLDAMMLHIAQAGAASLLARFPVAIGTMTEEAMAHNQAMQGAAANIRDFQIAHYRLNRRIGEPLWDAARTATGPASLDVRLSLFAARARVAMLDHEIFQEPNWAAIFVGHGIVPRAYDPLVDVVPEVEQIEKTRRLLQLIAAEVGKMPTVESYLAGGGR